MPTRMLPALIALLVCVGAAFPRETPNARQPVTEKEADAWSASFRNWHSVPQVAFGASRQLSIVAVSPDGWNYCTYRPG